VPTLKSSGGESIPHGISKFNDKESISLDNAPAQMGFNRSSSPSFHHKPTITSKEVQMNELLEHNNDQNFKSVSHSHRKKRSRWMNQLEKFLESYPTVIFMSVLTVYTLFFDDIRVVSLEKIYDDIFFGITASCLAIFAVEIFLASLSREAYFLTFFFWLDIISTISMLPDIGWIWDMVTGEGGTPQAGNAAQLVKTSRAGRVTRIIRVIRLIRLIRIVKLYKQAKLA
jgi:hypothetical protein